MNENKLTKPENIIDDFIKNKLIVFLIIFLFLLVAIFLTALQKKEYSSTSQVLIIQEQENKMDAYLASKSSESLAKNLRKAILTSSFRNKVLKDLTDLDLDIFSKSEKNKRKEWLKTVNVKIIPNTSILEIKSYNNSAFQSEKILNKILNTLLENHQLYHGGGDDIRLEIINNPLTSNHPTRPNWALNLFLSLILAIFFVITLLIMFPNKINFFNRKLHRKNYKEDKNKIINENNGHFKVFDYLNATPKEKINLPNDLFEEISEDEEKEDEDEGFFVKNGFNNNQEKKINNTNTNTMELENNKEIKRIIDNNHYLKRKE
jgi:capsular polysaccharide biosynthesis protein